MAEVYYCLFVLPPPALSRAVVAAQALLAERYGIEHASRFIPHISLTALLKLNGRVEQVYPALDRAIEQAAPVTVYTTGIRTFGQDVIFVDANDLPDGAVNLPLRYLHSTLRTAFDPLLASDGLFTPHEFAHANFYAHITLAQKDILPLRLQEIVEFCRSTESSHPFSWTASHFQLYGFTSNDWAGNLWDGLKWTLVREWKLAH